MQGIYCIRRTGTVEFYAADAKMRIRAGGCLHQVESQVC